MKIIISTCLVLFLTVISTTLFAFTLAEKAEKLSLIKRLKNQGTVVYAILPKNVTDPFYSFAANGCDETAKQFAARCIFYGSASANMRNQVEDILALINAGIDGIAIAGVRNGFIAETIGEELQEWAKPIIAFDSPLNTEIAQSYIGTNNYLLGKALGKEIRKLKPDGGTFCIQSERPDSPNHNDRFEGIVDGLTSDGTESAKWKNNSGCPMHHMSDFKRANGQMLRAIDQYKVEVFIITGGGPQFLPKVYREIMAAYKGDIESGKLVLASIDTIPAQLQHLNEGISTVNVGQRPYQMGRWAAKVLNMITNGDIPPAVINTGLTYCNKDTVETCTQH